MVVVTGKNLGERQQDLNKKVSEVVANRKSFDEIEGEKESTDIDRLYKIDVASQYQNIDYILKVLKSGDSLYISRALKCLWLYEDSFTHFVNPENLHRDVFPYMSIKMKKKMLITVAMHIKDKDEAAAFFTYCKKNKMSSIAFKFINITSEEFKLNVVKTETMSTLSSYLKTQNQLKNFVGSSFVLAISYLERFEWYKETILHNLRFLYSVCNDEYLDILEKYAYVDLDETNVLNRFGLRISKSIMQKHKNRVLNKPLLYVNKLNKSILAKYSTIEDSKTYITGIMPQHVDKFWSVDFGNTYNYVLDLLPIHEKFKYLKQLFTTKYPGEPFEMTINFYKLKYYEMLSMDERELWALRHVEGQLEILGSGNDYIWYKFVNVDKALIEIKKYIMITPDKEKRSSILNILVESARNENDLMKVINYYYDRHVNESEYYKEIFIDKVLDVHNVFEFNIDCWEALNQLFYSLEIYTAVKYITYTLYTAIAVVCYVLHKKDLPQALINFVDLDINYSYFSLLLKRLCKDKTEILFQYLLKWNVTKLEPFEQDPHNKELRKKLKQYVNNIFTLLGCFKKDDKERPEVVTKFMDIDSPTMKKDKKVTAEDIFRMLKKDASMTVDVLSGFTENIDGWPKRLNHVLRKLKVYFFNDIAQEYNKFFDDWLRNNPGGFRCNHAIVFGIFQLADEHFKLTLMEKYHPTEPKINHRDIDRNLLFVQEAICRFVGYSRPPLPLESVLKYIKGDYVHYCLPMFNKYLVNLPLPQAIKFTESILNTPLSVQKHGIRLAFKCFNINDLKNLATNVWKRTKNVSLRMLLYKSLFAKIREADEDTQTELYKVLKLYTSDLHQDDHTDVFYLLTSNQLSDKFIGDYLRTSWEMVIKLPQKPINIERQIEIIKSIERNINFVETELVRKRIIEDHIHEVLEARKFKPLVMCNIGNVSDAKWHLTATFIVKCSNDDELKERLNLLKFIFERCVHRWNEEDFIFRRFYFDFIQIIKQKSNRDYYDNRNKKFWAYNIPIFQHILDMLLKALPMKEIYLTVWYLQLTIFAKRCFNDGDTDLRFRLENSELLSIEELTVNFANQIGAFVKELLEKQKFYAIFLSQIAYLINKEVRGFPTPFKLEEKVKLYICESLANLGIMETHLLTSIILPEAVSNELKEHHTKILKNIQASENEEIQSFYYSKFCYGSF